MPTSRDLAKFLVALVVVTGVNIGVHELYVQFRTPGDDSTSNKGGHNSVPGHAPADGATHKNSPAENQLFLALIPDRAAHQHYPSFLKFEQDFRRDYDGGAHGSARVEAFTAFAQNMDYIKRRNAEKLPFSLGITPFVDMTNAEYRRRVLKRDLSKASKTGAAKTTVKGAKRGFEGGKFTHLGTHKYSGVELPTEVDWVKQGAVTPPKNQGQCGSCWSFSTTGALEGAWKIASGKLVSLSEQEFVDCDEQDNACNGGIMEMAFQFAEQNGICTEASYPYKGRKHTECRTDKCTMGIPKGKVVGFKDVDKKDDAALQEALSKQPVSIAIEADQPDFQLYKNGTLIADCGTELDHGVLAVGYGEYTNAAGEKDLYWKVKNSWGPEWGNHGFIYIGRGPMFGDDGECGILDDPSFPVIGGEVVPEESVSEKVEAVAAEGVAVQEHAQEEIFI